MNFAKPTILPAILLFLLTGLHQSSAATLPLKLAWNRNSEEDLAYYKVYYGTTSRNYSNSITVDKQYPSCTLDANRLTVGKTYYIALTAFDFSLNESRYSSELVVTIDPPSQTTTTISNLDPVVIEAEQMSYHTNGRQEGDFWNLWANGTMNEEVYFASSGTYRFEIIARGKLAYEVGPEMELLLDGVRKGSIFVNNTTAQTYLFNLEVSQGTHEIAIGFYNDVYNPSEGIDRNLYVDKTIITLASGTPVSSTTSTAVPSTFLQEHCSMDIPLTLQGTIPEEGTINVTIPDNLKKTLSASLFLTLWDPDVSGEGYIYVNGYGPVDLPVGNYDNQVHNFIVSISKNWLMEGNNVLKFTHVDSMGYEVRSACVLLTFSVEAGTTTSSLPPPFSTTIPPAVPVTTTTLPPTSITTSTTTIVFLDETPPAGTIVINSGDETTQSLLVTLTLSAEDEESGMGQGALMSFSNDAIEWSSPEPFGHSKKWLISPEEGEKTVYATFCDAAGNWMEEPISDSIWLEGVCAEPHELHVAAISSSGDFHPLFAKECAVDGEYYTGWMSPVKFFVEEEHLTLDLGESQRINRIELSSHPLLFLDLFPLSFRVEASRDNENWFDLLSVEHYYPLPDSYTDSWAFDEQLARYLRLVITQPKPFLFFFYLSYIPEIKIYGCP